MKIIPILPGYEMSVLEEDFGGDYSEIIYFNDEHATVERREGCQLRDP